MKRNWLNKVYKMSRSADMSVGDMVKVIRSHGMMKMNIRTSSKKGKTEDGEPYDMFGLTFIPTVSKRTGKTLHSRIERK